MNTGEHLIYGQIGHLFLILSFVLNIVCCFSFWYSYFYQTTYKFLWHSVAKISFIIQTVLIISTIFILIYLLHQHYYEYKYVYLHSDNLLPFKYLLSCLWEGQEGSFLLWIFWNSIIGIYFIVSKSHLQATVLKTISFIQIWLLSFIVGVYVFDLKIGVNPFNLLKHEFNWPILSKPDYLLYVQNGTGLNTLLQNYWMVIHPPILFLGFASVVVPFSLVVDGLWKKNNHWMSEIRSATSFSVAVLGLGILMGAAWAYESLSFGGYWAWDPVENASLVPWLILVCAAHGNLISMKRKSSAQFTILLYGLAFILIVYSTFLTRSGILGDTSVHAFTDLGMNLQLLLFVIATILYFVLPYIFILIKKIQHKLVQNVSQTTEKLNSYSKEFWLFFFVMFQFFISLFIIFKTSLPVINKIFGTTLAPGKDIKFSYNAMVIFLVIYIGIMSGFVFYFGNKSYFKNTFNNKKTITALVLALIVGIIFFQNLHIYYDENGILFAILICIAFLGSICGLVLNISFIIRHFKQISFQKLSIHAIHFGFVLMLVGIIISSASKQVWTKKIIGDSIDDNVLLKEFTPTVIKNYTVTLVKDSDNLVSKETIFYIDFFDNINKRLFTLEPVVIKNNKGGEGYSANPDVKHFFNKDVFVYITSFQERTKLDVDKGKDFTIKINDTIVFSNGFMKLNEVEIKKQDGNQQKLVFHFIGKNWQQQELHLKPELLIKGTEIYSFSDSNMVEKISIKFLKINDVAKSEFTFNVIDKNQDNAKTITIKINVFPYINLLWMGAIILVLASLVNAFLNRKFLKPPKTKCKY